MTLASGDRLGPYEIVSLVGAGGMGEVYKARDTRLDRTIAIKILPAAHAADPLFRERFDREARTISSLEHPAICPVYDVGVHGAIAYLVMRFVDGETLADRLARGAVPIAAALDIADRIASALAAAHDRGIVHRDLKPGNVMIARDGGVQVLDFGLAKNVVPTGGALSVAETAAAAATSAGAILGTAAYMAPEQVRGFEIDRRADIWAFGCVVFEMLTGRRSFEGATAGDSLAAVLTREPDWSALPAALPDEVRRLVGRCLQKERERRLRDIGDVRLLLEDASSAASTRGGAIPPVRAWPIAWIAAAVFAIATLLAGAFIVGRPADAAAARAMRLDLVTPPSTDPESFVLAPDGSAIAFAATTDGVARLAIRRLDETAARVLDGTENATQPFWSPDGRSVAFFAERKLKRVEVAGGSPAVIADAPTPRGGSWNRDDTIVFAPATPGGLMRVSASGGPAAVLTTAAAPGALSHRWPEFLPDGRSVLFFGTLGSAQSRGIYIARIDGGSDPRRIVDSESGAQFVAPDRLLYVTGGKLVAVRFDAASATLSGDPTVVADGVSRQVKGAFSAAGRVLAYRLGSAQRRQLQWVSRDGMASPVGEIDTDAVSSPELTRDGRRAVVQRFVQGNVDLWIVDTLRGVPTRLTFDATVDAHGIWSPDGTRLVFAAVRDGRVGLYVKSIEGATADRALPAAGAQPMPCDWSPDGRFVLYSAEDRSGGNDLWAQPLDGGSAIPVVQTPFDDTGGQFSPDGEWIAYQSDASGRIEIYVAPFGRRAPPLQVSSAGGMQPRWRRDGRELFYIAPDGHLVAVPVSRSQSSVEVGATHALFATRLAAGINIAPGRAQYAVGPDGRFLVNASVGDLATPPITLVLNWLRTVRD